MHGLLEKCKCNMCEEWKAGSITGRQSHDEGRTWQKCKHECMSVQRGTLGVNVRAQKCNGSMEVQQVGTEV